MSPSPLLLFLMSCLHHFIDEGFFKNNFHCLNLTTNTTVRPRFIDPKRREHIQAVQNETIQLMCEATGEPRPQFAWFKRDVEILRPKVIQSPYAAAHSSNMVILSGDQILQISNIQSVDQGEYACTASNGGGTIEKKFNVTVIGELGGQ